LIKINQNKNYLSNLIVLLTSILLASNSLKSTANEHLTSNQIGVFALSETFTDILPIKQIVDDKWVDKPSKHSSDAFSQHELGIKGKWEDLTFSISKRYDYFVHSNKDTAIAYYLDQSDKGLLDNQEYNLNLHLYHQEAEGIRLGYRFTINNFEASVSVGYWDVAEIRSSKVNGVLNSNVNGDITGQAGLEEYYSHKNFLKRQNNDSWDTEGYGLSLDIDFTWAISNTLTLRGELKDIYNDFVLKNSGYSTGDFNTSGRFINSIGGVGYLPVYSGKETEEDHHLSLPERIKLTGVYAHESISSVIKLTRQGDVPFYYAGIESNDGAIQLLLDLKNMTPEFSYRNHWVSFVLGIDSTSEDKAQKVNLGLSLQYAF
jgi:hypothetical protein